MAAHYLVGGREHGLADSALPMQPSPWPQAPWGFVARDELDELRGALLGDCAIAITGS